MSPRRTTWIATAAIVAAVAILYVLCAKLGLALAFRAAQVSAVWPPTGFALAATVLLGRRAIPGILLGTFAANATAGEPAWVAAGIDEHLLKPANPRQVLEVVQRERRVTA